MLMIAAGDDDYYDYETVDHDDDHDTDGGDDDHEHGHDDKDVQVIKYDKVNLSLWCLLLRHLWHL